MTPTEAHRQWEEDLLAQHQLGRISTEGEAQLRALALLRAAQPALQDASSSKAEASAAMAKVCKALVTTDILVAPELDACIAALPAPRGDAASGAHDRVRRLLHATFLAPEGQERMQVVIGLLREAEALVADPAAAARAAAEAGGELTGPELTRFTVRTLATLCNVSFPQHPDLRDLLRRFAALDGTPRAYSWLSDAATEAGEFGAALEAARAGLAAARAQGAASWEFALAHKAAMAVALGAAGRPTFRVADVEPYAAAMRAAHASAPRWSTPWDGRSTAQKLAQVEDVLRLAQGTPREGFPCVTPLDGTIEARALLQELGRHPGIKQVSGYAINYTLRTKTPFDFDLDGDRLTSASPTLALRILRGLCRPGCGGTVLVVEFPSAAAPGAGRGRARGGRGRSRRAAKRKVWGYEVDEGQVERLDPAELSERYMEMALHECRHCGGDPAGCRADLNFV